MKMETVEDFCYMDYFLKRTEADQKLTDLIYEYEEMFEDFNFYPNSIVLC